MTPDPLQGEPRPPVPPFTAETAARKVRAAEDAWNGRDPAKVALDHPTLSELGL